MSTILRALQKQKSEQSHTMPAFIEKEGSIKWKLALLASLLVIISLLAVVIYLLVNPVDREQPPAFSAPVATLHSVNKEVLAISKKTEDKLIRKISFDLAPLPTVSITDPLPEATAQLTEALESGAEQAVVVSAEKPVPADNFRQEIDYGDTSADLQLRFENALLISGAEDKEVVEQVQKEGDGSDIHQMSSEFQSKVPAISYASHIYSSVPAKRWVRINDEDLKEGQFDSSGQIEVIEIQAERTIFRVGRQSFSLELLTDWQGF